jgi:hypothetical protein
MMPKITKSTAARFAPKLRARTSWDDARDLIDTWTNGELDPTQLDLLTDWTVEERDKLWPRAVERRAAEALSN